ncbi:MAG: winged helix DNA-binding protein, partial [Rhodobacteraceae bacterium]|nr:winged helix DNA-binding protein [Paracoccaceae bacterium]
DGATIKGVVDRLTRQGLVETSPDPEDRRRLTVSLTAEGTALFAARMETGLAISARTLDPLTAAEQAQLLTLLARLT